MAATQTVRSVQFGAFRLDLQTLQLTKGGTKVRVPEQSLQILALLLQRPGELVTREEVLEKLWPNGTIVEFEHSINAAVNRLRAGLGDVAEKPRFIETLPRRGYRFIFPLENPAPDQLAGQQISHYRVIEKLGQGAMGVVYRAEDTKLGRTVALKFLTAKSGDSKARERFEREARAASALNDPNICTVHEIDEHQGFLFITMEYLAGKSLDQLIGSEGLPIDKVLSYAAQIADALARAHAAGIVHRDLKPSNVMVNREGVVKLLDFGLAKVRHAEPMAAMSGSPTNTALLTGERAILGTLQYMAPEQLEGKEADARTDIFALGAVIYEMATARKAFEPDGQAGLISAILTTEPPASPKLQSIPALDHVVRTCVGKSPDKRWQSAQDVAVELRWLAQSGGQARPTAPIRAKWNKRELWALVIGAVLLIAALGLAFLNGRDKREQARPVRFTIQPPEHVQIADFAVAGPPLISPDGSRLAFVGINDRGQSELWVRPLDSFTPKLLAETAEQAYPFWSPDSRYLAFFAEGKLKKVSVDGGPPRVLCNAPNGRGGAWTRLPEGSLGTILFSPDRFVPLARVSAAGGDPVCVTAFDSARREMSHRQPEFLPDGYHFLYSVRDRSEKSAVFVGDLRSNPQSQKPRLLMDGTSRASYSPPGYLLFVRENNLLAERFDAERLELRGEPLVAADNVDKNDDFNVSDFSVSGNGVLAWRQKSPPQPVQVTWFDRSGRQLPGLDLRLELNYDSGQPRLSPDLRTIAVQKGGNIWLFDPVRGSASRLTYGVSQAQDNPVWSPDGRRIAFSQEDAPHSALYWKDSTGDRNPELLLAPEPGEPPWDATDWSRDGRFLLLQRLDLIRLWDIWLLPLTGERKPVPLLQTEFSEGEGHFSPDGRWIAYRSNQSGRNEVYVRSFPEGGTGVAPGKWTISTAGGEKPRWRRDGKELFYLAPDGKMMAVPVHSGSTFEAGVPVPLFDAHDHRPGDFDYDINPDGQRFLISRTLEGGPATPVSIWLNWLAGVKR